MITDISWEEIWVRGVDQFGEPKTEYIRMPIYGHAWVDVSTQNIEDVMNATMIYQHKDIKVLEEDAAKRIEELAQTDPEAAEKEKERIWRAICDISQSG